MRFGVLLLFFLWGMICVGKTLTHEEKAAELKALASTIQNQYGPLDYKAEVIEGFDFQQIVLKYIERAKQTDNLQFYYLINQFVAEFKDSHFSSRLNTDHLSYLGIIVDRVENRVLIDEIDRKVLSKEAFPFERGDEILTMGRQPVAEVIDHLKSYRGLGTEKTALRYATILLTYRSAAILPKQEGTVSLGIRSQKTQEIETVELEWQHSGELFEGDAIDQNASPIDYANLSIKDVFSDLPQSEKNFRCSGTTRIKIPEGATHLLKKPFVAYYHDTDFGKVGYLRIPHYYWINASTGANENELRLAQYEWVLSEMEKNTVALIIDQDHNCGGSVSLVEAMVGLFAKEPYQGIQFKFLASRNEYFNFKSWMTTESATTLAGANFIEVLNLLKATYFAGKRLTPKVTFGNNALIEPNPTGYSKPVLILIDEMSGSGGDAFPAMMQGIGRAKLFGTRTMGAGGHVENLPALNYSANNLRITKSLFFHPDGTAIENNGASPDFEYTPTREDFLSGYQGYQKNYLMTLKRMVEGSPS